MTKDDLRNYIRVLVDDTQEDYLCSNATMDTFIDEAEREAFERGLYGLLDESYDISVSAGVTRYEIDPLIFAITRLKLSGQQTILTKTTKRELDFQINNWKQTNQSTPLYWYQEGANLELYPPPDAAYTLLVDGYRYPESAMELPEELHEKLAYWVMFRFYSLQDVDAQSLQKAEMNRQLFNSVFGHKQKQDYLSYWHNGALTSPMRDHPFI